MSDKLELKVDLLTEKVNNLNEKMERILLLLSDKKKRNVLPEESDLTHWSAEDYKNSVLIKFSFNTEFKDYIKELGGTWMVAKKAWMFPKSNYQDILESLQEKFPKWTFTNSINPENFS
jgi:hypothetical protein